MIRYLLFILASNWVFAPTSPTPSPDLAIRASADAATSFMGFLEGMLFHPYGIWPYLFKVYNYGILAVMIFMVSFSIFYGAAMMASDGQGFSRKINVWVYVRSIAGMALLVPMGSNQFAAIQYLVMRVVWWSIWLSGYVFSGVILSMPMLSDTLENRMAASNVATHYTQMASMAACALSYAPNMTYYESNTSTTERVINFTWNPAAGAIPAGYTFNYRLPSGAITSLTDCGRIDAAASSPSYILIMNDIVSSLRTLAQPIISRAREMFDDNVRSAAAGTIPDASVSDLCHPYGLVRTAASGCSTGAASTPTTPCWDQSRLDTIYRQYAQIIPTTTSTAPGTSASVTTAMNSLNIGTFISEFNNIQTMVLANTGSSTPTPATYNLPTGSVVSPSRAKSFINWLDDQAAHTDITIRGAQERAIERRAASATEAIEKIRQLRARNEIANQVYRLLFQAIGSISSWYTPPTASSLTAYMGETGNLATGVTTPYIQSVMSEAVGSVEIPDGTPSNPQWAGVRIHIVPRAVTSMLRSSLSELTGCTPTYTRRGYGGSSRVVGNCTSMPGKGIFGYQIAPRSPIEYIQDMGLNIATHGVNYQKLMTSNNGIIREDDNINRIAYAASAVTMAAAVAAQTAVTVYPIISYMRFAHLVIYAASAILIESYNYMSDLDQYALYKYEPLGSAASTLLMIWGGMFGVFLPAVPYMVILFSVIGWIFLIIEAMFATPLIALGLTHPNSHQFLGASDQTLMMLLLLALRPVTIMIGSFFALYIAQNAVYFLNEGIIRFMEAYFDIRSASVNVPDFSALLFGVMLVYSYTLFVVLVQSFSIIGLLPDKIGSWIGMGPMGGVNPIQQIMGLRSSIESTAQQGAQGVSSTSKAKRASHSQDGVNYRKVLSIEKAESRAGAVMLSSLGRRSLQDMRDGLSSKDVAMRKLNNARSDDDIKRLVRDLKGSTKEAAIKLLKSDASAEDKLKFLKEVRSSGWRGKNYSELNGLLKDNGVSGYKFGTEMSNNIDEAIKLNEKRVEQGMKARTPDEIRRDVSDQRFWGAVYNGQMSKALVIGTGIFVARLPSRIMSLPQNIGNAPVNMLIGAARIPGSIADAGRAIRTNAGLYADGIRRYFRGE